MTCLRRSARSFSPAGATKSIQQTGHLPRLGSKIARRITIQRQQDILRVRRFRETQLLDHDISIDAARLEVVVLGRLYLFWDQCCCFAEEPCTCVGGAIAVAAVCVLLAYILLVN